MLALEKEAYSTSKINGAIHRTSCLFNDRNSYKEENKKTSLAIWKKGRILRRNPEILREKYQCELDNQLTTYLDDHAS